MIILGIETSTRLGSVALIDETRLIAEYRVSLEMKQAERLLPLIDAMLKETKIALSDLGAIAVSVGPGSFTGLRVGIATAKGLAIGRGLPLFPVPTLQAMALPFFHARAAILPMAVARKDEVYWAIFSPLGGRRNPDSVSSVEKVLEEMRQKEDVREVLFIGEGALLHKDKIIKDFNGHPFFPSIGLQLPMASSVAQMGLAQVAKGESFSAEEIVPAYLHEVSPIRGLNKS